jgi:TusA-related sulfurtransferase
VRALEMPLPMITILNEIKKMEDNQALYVQHKKVPHFLLPELKDSGFSYLIKEDGEGDVKLLIYK